MAWFVGTSGTRSRWLFPLVLAQFWLFMVMLIVGYFVTMPSNFVHQRTPGFLRINNMPKVLFSAGTSQFVGDCHGSVTLLDLSNFPISGEPISANAVLIKPIPLFEYCSIGTHQTIPTVITGMLEPICRVAKPLNVTTSATGQAEFNLCQLYGPPGLYSLHFDLLGEKSNLNVSFSIHIRMIAAPFRLKLNDEAPSMLEPGCNNTGSKTCANGPQNARVFFGKEPVPNLRIVLTATHVSMLPHLFGANMTAIRPITRWPALSMLSYGAAMLADSEAISDAFGYFNFSKLNILGYTTSTTSLAVYFGGRLQLWNSVKYLNGVYWVRESAIRREFSARMNAPCAIKIDPVESKSDGIIKVLPDQFLSLSGKFCSFVNEASGTVEFGLSGRVAFIHIVPSFDIAVLDSARSREYFKHPFNATSSISLADGTFKLITKFTSEGQPGIYTLYLIADGQIMLSRKLLFPRKALQMASMFLPRYVQNQLLDCQKLFLRSDACHVIQPFSSMIGSEHSPSIRLTNMEKIPELIDMWHIGIANVQTRLYILPNNFTESRSFLAPNFVPNSLSFLSQESGIVSFPEIIVSHVSSSPSSLHYFSEQARIQIQEPTSKITETGIQRKISFEYGKYMASLQECDIPTCSVVQLTKLPTAFYKPFPAPHQVLGVNEDLDIRASIFDSEFSLQTSELIVMCAVFIKRHLWEHGLRYPSNTYQGSRVCNTNSPSGWFSSRSRPLIVSTVRYVLEPGEYVWFLQADADLTIIAIRNQFTNASFFFEGSSNVTLFDTQMPPRPLCRNAVAMARKAYRRCKSNFYFDSIGVRLPFIQFDGSVSSIATFQPSLDFVDLYSAPNGAMRNMDKVPWWRAEFKQASQVYLQLNDYMLSGDSEDPADNPISQKYVAPEARGNCIVLHGKMEDMLGFSFSRSRNPSVASGSVNDILGNYFYFTSLTLRWVVPEYSLVQCSINGVQSPILELFPVGISPVQLYTGCGNYPEASVMSERACNPRLIFNTNSSITCFPIGVTLPNITVFITYFDGTLILQEEQTNFELFDVDVQDSVVTDSFKIVRLNANQVQVTGLRFSFIRPGQTFLRLFNRRSAQKDISMLSKKFAPATDEVRIELETGCSTFVIGAPAVPFRWKVSLIAKCTLEGAFDSIPWVPPEMELFVAVCHADALLSSFDTFCHISNEVLIDSKVILQTKHSDSTFQLAADVRLIGGSPEISQSWRLIAKTRQNNQIVWLSDEIQISVGQIAMKALPLSNENCFIGTRCVFEFKAINTFGIPVPGASVTLVDNFNQIRNFSFSPRFHSAVSDIHGLLVVSIEFQEQVTGGIVVVGLILHDAGGTRYLTTKNVSVVNIVDSVTNPGKLDFSKDFVTRAFAPSFHFRSNRTELSLFGMDTIAFLITKESGKDDKQLIKPTFNILNSVGNKIVVLQSESSIFLTDWKGDEIKNATTFLQASTTAGKDALVFKFEYMVLNDLVPSGFYSVNYCFMGKCLQNEFELFVKNTLNYDDTFAEAIFVLTVGMTILVFALLPWSFHSDRPDLMSKKKVTIFFLCVVITTALQTQVASLLKATSLSKNYLQEFDFVVTIYSLLVPISICLCSLQALLSFYDASFNSSENAFRLNEQLAIRLITGQEKSMKLISWCKLTIEKLKKIQGDKVQRAQTSRPKRLFRSASLISIHTFRNLWGIATDRFVSAAIPTIFYLQKLIENYTPYEKTSFQKVSEYVASPRLLICVAIPLVLLPLLLFLVRVGVRVFQEIVYKSVFSITNSNVSWVRSNEMFTMLDFFNDASQTSVYAGRSVRHFTSDSIMHRIMLYFSQVLMSRDVQLLHDFLNQFFTSANVGSILCIITATVGFIRFFMVYRKYVHELRERGRRVSIDSKIHFNMHKSSSLVPGQFWSTIIGFFVAFMVFVLVCMIARWEPLKRYLANAVINPLIVTLVLHYVAVAVSRTSDSLFVPSLSQNSLWMPRRRLFSLYEFFTTMFSWLSAAGSMIYRFIISAAFWLCFAPMDFFQQKSLSFQSTDRDIVGSDRFIAAIGVDHVIDSPLTAALARLLIQNIDNFTTRSAFDKSKCDPLAIHLELEQYASREHRRFLLSRWEFLASLSTGTQAAADIKALRKPFLAATNYRKLPVTGFGSTDNYWNIVKMDPGIRDWLRNKEKPGLL